MRLVSGIVAAAPLRAVLTGDPSLSRRPMERVADPLRAMGATIATTDGHPPVRIDGGELRGREYRPATPSAQVKSAVLLAGLRAEGTTTVIEPAPTRDHTERALAALGAPIEAADGTIRVSAYQHAGFEGRVPGDPSAAAFLIAAAALTGSELTLTGVGCNPTRLHFLDVMSRMGVRTTIALETTEVGEPVGTIHVEASRGIVATRVAPDELPLVIDEVPILAMLATAAPSDSWFLGAEELRVKESDRLKALTEGIRSLGGHAADEGDDLVVAGGGLAGGIAASEGDHRIGMAFAVAGLAARGPVEVREIEAADVSFPGFVPALAALGAHVEAVR
jgi:3-phosphoshikimate 1-carboxyvinyltransferase